MSPRPPVRRPSRPAARRTPTAEDSFGAVAAAFASDRRVACGGGKGFGSGALKVDGKIFAMMSSKREFVVKLPAQRVEQLVRDHAGAAQRFDPGRGKKMKEWLALTAKPEIWTDLAMEARQFVGNR